MDEEIEAPPVFAEGGEYGLDLSIVGHVERLDDRRTDARGKGPYPALQGIALEGECQFRTFAMRALGDAPGQ